LCKDVFWFKFVGPTNIIFGQLQFGQQTCLLVKTNWPTDMSFGQNSLIRQTRLLVKDYLSDRHVFWSKTNRLTDIAFGERP
jgi:hypothetical protein